MEKECVKINGLHCPYCENPIDYNFGHDVLEQSINLTRALNLCIGCECEKMFLLTIFSLNKFIDSKAFHYITYDDKGFILQSQKTENTLVLEIKKK